MAVPEQTPYIEHTGNGVTTSFSLEFQCESKDHLIVLVDEIEPPIATWSLTGGNVVFATAPAAGKKITVQRNTPFSRTTDYQSYNNSFRPPAVNKDFDWIWLKLQELGVADWILSNRIDALKNYVDDRDDELRAYLMEEIRKQGVALDQLDEYYNYLMQRLAQIAVDKGWDASFVVSADGSTQQDINDFGGAKWRNKAGGYTLGATVKLSNGNVVKSTVPNNMADPNIDMTGWFDAEDYLLRGSTGIDPDYFEGTDVQKLQQAYDSAFALGGRVVNIVLGRRYDVTGGSIWIKPDYFKRPIVKFRGGEIFKGDAGFIVDRATADASADAPRFYGTSFEGAVPETYIFNCSRMIRPVAFYCDYYRISFAKSDTYIQSIRILGGETSFQLSSFIKGQVLFDPRISHLQGEAASNHFLDLTGNGGTSFTVNGGYISNNLFEAYTAVPFKMGSALGTEFDGNYFESVPSVFKFIPKTNDQPYFQASFSNNMVAAVTGDCVFDATERGDITVMQFAAVENNGMMGWKDAALTPETRFMVKGAILYRRGGKPNYFTQGGTESNIRTQTWQVGVVLAKTVQIPSGNGIRAVIGGINTDSGVRMVDVASKPLLVSISGQMASGSPTYRFSTVGVLTFEVSFVGGQLVDRVVFKPIQHGAIAGNNNGATGTDADFSCVWADTGTATRPHGALINVENQVFINLPNTYYASASALVSAVPISSIVAETSSTFLPNISRS